MTADAIAHLPQDRVSPARQYSGTLEIEGNARSRTRPSSHPREELFNIIRDATVAQFSNAYGGTLVIGAEEENQTLQGFRTIPSAEDVVRRLNDLVSGLLTPVPAIDARPSVAPTGEGVVIVNVPAAPRLVARRAKDQYEFPVRTGDSRRYLTLMEVEARMQDHERRMRLTLDWIGSDRVIVDADIRGDSPAPWMVTALTDETVTLVSGALNMVLPMAYIEVIYRTNEPANPWVISLQEGVQFRSFLLRASCHYT